MSEERKELIDITLLACTGELGRNARITFAAKYGVTDLYRFTKMALRRQNKWVATGHVLYLDHNWKGMLYVAHIMPEPLHTMGRAQEPAA